MGPLRVVYLIGGKTVSVVPILKIYPLGGLKSKSIVQKYIESADEGLKIESEMI
jgi:hypothetical protein